MLNLGKKLGFRRGLVLATLAMAQASSWGSMVSFSGSLDDVGNTALVGSCPDPTTCNDPSQVLSFDPAYVANNVALYVLHVANAGVVTFVSSGYGLGGIDPYFTLFSGVGGSAQFRDSNYATAGAGGGPGGDFTLIDFLPTGDYTLALGADGNMSLAENWGAGSLADGFTALGNGPQDTHTYAYVLNVTLADGNGGGGGGGGGQLPEPGTAALAAAALLMIPSITAWGRRRQR